MKLSDAVSYLIYIWSYVCPLCGKQISRSTLYLQRISVICPKCGSRLRLGFGYGILFIVVLGYAMIHLIRQKLLDHPTARSILAGVFLVLAFALSPLFVTVRKWDKD